MVETNCPACGAPLTFRSSHAVQAVCGYCQSTIVRHDLDLKNLGRMADVREDHTPLQIGAAGSYQGTPFQVVGRLQVAFDGGTWNEWFLMLADGREGWLGESNGNLAIMFEHNLGPSGAGLRYGSLRVGAQVSGLPASFVVTEKREARVIGAQGELPFSIEGGWALPFADLQGIGIQFGTLDFSDEAAPRAYVGHWVRMRDLKMVGLRNFESFGKSGQKQEVLARQMGCPQCGGPITLHVPGQTQHIGCPSCGSTLSVEDENVSVLAAHAKVYRAPLIPLGSEGEFGGTKFKVIGMMTRAVNEDGEWYPWDEYLLFNPYEGYRWLVCSNGHYSFVEPVLGIPAEGSTGRTVEYRGKSFRFFTSGAATVQYVLGEFYWKVVAGQTVATTDYIAPPFMLSREGDGTESVWSVGTYVTPDLVWKTFSLPGNPSSPSGVAPNQPADPGGIHPPIMKTWYALTGVMLLVTLTHLAFANPTVVQSVRGEVNQEMNAGLMDATLVSESFEITGSSAAMEVKTFGGVSNSWLSLTVAIVDTTTQEILPVYSSVEEWHGTGWTEGNNTDVQVVGPLGPGTYTLRITPEWQKWSGPSRPDQVIPYEVTLTHDVRRVWPLVISFLLLCLGPLFSWLRIHSVENSRWQAE